MPASQPTPKRHTAIAHAMSTNRTALAQVASSAIRGPVSDEVDLRIHPLVAGLVDEEMRGKMIWPDRGTRRHMKEDCTRGGMER